MRRRGFTLLEVLLAIALIVIIVVMAGSMLMSVAAARDDIERYTLRQTAADALLGQIEADLLGVVAGDGAGSVGVQGTAEKLSLLTRGRWLGLETARASDLCRTEVTVERGKVTLVRRGTALGTLAPLGDGVRGEVEGVRRAEFWYHDGRAWKREFNSVTEGGLPRAVEVRLWFGEPTRMPEPAEGVAAEDLEAAARAMAMEDERGVDTAPDRRLVIAVPDGGVASGVASGAAGGPGRGGP